MKRRRSDSTFALRLLSSAVGSALLLTACGGVARNHSASRVATRVGSSSPVSTVAPLAEIQAAAQHSATANGDPAAVSTAQMVQVDEATAVRVITGGKDSPGTNSVPVEVVQMTGTFNGDEMSHPPGATFPTFHALVFDVDSTGYVRDRTLSGALIDLSPLGTVVPMPPP